MNKLIINKIIKDRICLIVLILISTVVVFFVWVGVRDMVWKMPAKNSEIQRLTDLCNAKQNRIRELDKYIIDREAKYRVATKFDNLFMLIADPNQIMDFEVLDGYIKSRKAFFIKTKGGKP